MTSVSATPLHLPKSAVIKDTPLRSNTLNPSAPHLRNNNSQPITPTDLWMIRATESLYPITYTRPSSPSAQSQMKSSCSKPSTSGELTIQTARRSVHLPTVTTHTRFTQHSLPRTVFWLEHAGGSYTPCMQLASHGLLYPSGGCSQSIKLTPLAISCLCCLDLGSLLAHRMGKAVREVQISSYTWQSGEFRSLSQIISVAST